MDRIVEVSGCTIHKCPFFRPVNNQEVVFCSITNVLIDSGYRRDKKKDKPYRKTFPDKCPLKNDDKITVFKK